MRFARIVAALAPLLAALTLAFALLHLYYAARILPTGNWGMTIFYAVFGVAGIALAIALWRVRQQMKRRPQ